MPAPISMQTSGVHHIAIRVRDFERARRFYVDLLGFPVLLEKPNLVIVAAGATGVAIRGPEEQTAPDDQFDPFRVGLDHIALACGDETELARVTAALTAAGVENTGVKLDAALGRMYVAFKDPDRIAWELYMV